MAVENNKSYNDSIPKVFKWIFLTITFQQGLLGIDPGFQYRTSIPLVWNLLYRASKKYMVAPELTLKGQIHYHCLIENESLDRIKFFKQTLPSLKRYGFVDVQYVRSLDNVIAYIYKDKELMEKLLGICLPITQQNVSLKRPSITSLKRMFGNWKEITLDKYGLIMQTKWDRYLTNA